MTAQVDFYVLESSDEQTRMKTVCRLADKVQRMGHDIYVLTVDSNQSQMLNDLMWTFSQSSFLPHAMVNDADNYQEQQPVLIHHELIDKQSQVLINLQQDTPKIDNFQRIVEIVNQDETIRNNGRHKYRMYKEKSYEVKTHNIST